MITLPTWCACGKVVQYAGADRCEDCFVNATVEREKVQTDRAEIKFLSERESAAAERRAAYIHQVFEKGGADVPFIPQNAVRPGKHTAR